MTNKFFVADHGMFLSTVLAELDKRSNLSPWFLVVFRTSDDKFYVLDYRSLADIVRSGSVDPNFPLGELAIRLRWSETLAVQHDAIGPRGLQNLLLVQTSGYLVLLAGDAIHDVIRRVDLGGNTGRTIDIGGVTIGNNCAGHDNIFNIKPLERQINGWIDGVNTEESLQPGDTYELMFDVAESHANNRLHVAIEPYLRELSATRTLIEITVIIDPIDFRLYGADQQTLVVPTARGSSKNRVMFTIEAPAQGPADLAITFLLDGRLIQRQIMTFQIGEGGKGKNTTRIQGITLESATRRMRTSDIQRITLQVLPITSDGGGYRLFYIGTGVHRAVLKIDKDALDAWIEYARNEMDKIVTPADPHTPKHYHQNDLAILPEVANASLRALAKLGRRLFNNLFGSQHGKDILELGQALKELSQRQSLVLQIAAEKFFFPWALLYDGNWSDDPDWIPDWHNFWGFKHAIECLPEYSLASVRSFDPVIIARNQLPFAFVCNTQIDDQYGPLVANQRTIFTELHHLTVQEYQRREEFLGLLCNSNAPSLVYCYCHAKAYSPREGVNGVDDSFLELSDGELTLRDMREAVLDMNPPHPQFSLAPLVFINACQSVRLSPYLYDGLMPFLLQLGARGVLGTEIDTPAPFAASFAKDLLEQFTAGGQPLGSLLLTLRQKYMSEYNNFQGLLYTLYCSGEVVVDRHSN